MKNENLNIPKIQSEYTKRVSGMMTWILVFFALYFPLTYDDYYFNILETKYQTYYVFMFILFAAVGVVYLSLYVMDKRTFDGKLKLAPYMLSVEERKKNKISEIALIGFWFFALVGTIFSDYQYESFWGNEGRYSGLFLITIYTIGYFVIRYFWYFSSKVIQAFLISGVLLMLLGITDYFQMDILSFRTRIDPSQATLFVSTLGNINSYTAYVAIVMGVSSGLFLFEKNGKRLYWYYSIMVISFFSIIMGNSDNAYLAIGALLGFAPLLLFSTKRGIFRYLIMLASFVTVIYLIDVINTVYVDQVAGIDSLFGIIGGTILVPIVMVILWLFVGGILYLNKKKQMELDKQSLMPLRIWQGLLILAVSIIIFMWIDANVFGNASRYGGLGYYLLFNDQWGTNRGYIWRKSVEMFMEFPIHQKLIGFGPDTFGILTTSEIMDEMIAATGEVFDNAHNEYLQFLLTNGILGLMSYLTFLIGAIVTMVRKGGKDPYVMGCLIGILCYSMQASVNLNLPVVTPMLWFMISSGIARIRNLN